MICSFLVLVLVLLIDFRFDLNVLFFLFPWKFVKIGEMMMF